MTLETDVLLINPPTSFMGTHKMKSKEKSKELFFYPPLGLGYLASILIDSGFSVEIIDSPTLQLTQEDLISKIDKLRPSIVGISSTTPQIYSTLYLARSVKEEISSDIKIILGGSHISADPNFVNRFPVFDHAILGEAEILFPQIVQKILDGKKIRKMFRGDPPKMLDSLPYPSYDLLPMDKYFMPIHSKHFSSMLTSRGCPFNCLYCSRPAISHFVRYRSGKNTVDEIKLLEENFSVGWIQFVDDTFTLSKKHVEDICKNICDEHLDTYWGCQTRCDLVNREMLNLMYKAGCREITFGVENGSFHIRKLIGKNMTNRIVQKAFFLCQEVGIDTVSFWILGLPTETIKELNKTIKFACRLPSPYAEFHIATPFPGSRLFDLALNEGKITQKTWDDYAENGGRIPTYVPTKLTFNQLIMYQKKAYRSFYFRPKSIINQIGKIKSMSDIKRITQSAIIIWKEIIHS